MAVLAVLRVFLLALSAGCAAEAFIVTARSPRLSLLTPSLVRQHPTSAHKAATPPYLPSALRMAAYDDGSSAGGEVGGSTEMELQELVVDFTDDGRILLEVKGVKVGPMRQCTAPGDNSSLPTFNV